MTLKVIKTEKDYQKALKRLEVIFNAKKGSKGGDELELLSLLIDNYEKEKFPIELPDLIEAIKFRMEKLGYKQKDLAEANSAELQWLTQKAIMALNSTNFSLNGSEQSYLQQLINSSSHIQAYACSLLHLLTGSRCTVEPLLEPRSIQVGNAKQFQNNSDCRIYPNPVSGSIKLKDCNVNYTKFEIINATGQYVKLPFTNDQNIDISNLESGIYILRIFTENDVNNISFFKL